MNNKFFLQLIFFSKYITHLYFDNNIKKSKKIVYHFLKSHILVKIFVRISFFYIDLISIVLYRKKVNNLKYDQFQKIINFLEKINFLQISKISELFHALASIHLCSEEKQIKIKYPTILLNKKYYENIVIGSGPGGSITANELKKSNKEVLIIEKGDWFDHFKLKHPGNELLSKWQYGGLAVALGNIKIQYASAECFGGGSEINSGLYHEPDINFLNTWSEKFNTKNIKYGDLKNFIEETKKKTNVKYLDKFPTISEDIIRAANNNKWKIEEVPRWVHINNNNLKKKSMTQTYLKEYLYNKGQILLNTSVKKIYKKENVWNLRIKFKKKYDNVSCKNIFMCCGSINNLHLLNKSKLKTQNTEINLHPMIKIIVKFPKKINTENMEILTHQVTEFFPEFLIGNAASGLQFLRIAALDNNTFYQEVKKEWKQMLVFHATFSIGMGKIMSFPFLKDPVIFYDIENKELELVKNGMSKLSKLMFDAGCEFIYPITKCSNKLYAETYSKFINDIRDIKKFNFSSVHILGGVPMGEDINKCIVNSFGKMHNYDNLYINDSSLICNKLLKNPQGTTMAIALRNISNFLNTN